MESLKEHFSSKYFSSFGYIVAISYVPALVIFAGYTGQLRTSERRSFRCPSSPDSRDDCLVKYDQQFNSPFPLYGFVLLCFVPLLAVCIAYSWCFVKSRVDELEAALKADPENPRPRPRVTTRRVFYSYSLHLFVRLVLGILFSLLQNFVFYQDGFSTEFACVFPTVNPTVNYTVLNLTKDNSSLIINCDSPVGSDNAICAKGIWIVNSLFAVLVFGELCYLSVRAKLGKGFTFDSEFCQKHFFNKRETPVTLQENTFRMRRRIREDTEILEPLIIDEPECNRALDEIFVDLSIFTGRALHEFGDFSKRHEIFYIYLKPQRGAIHVKKLDELFLPNEDTQDPRKILVVGRPGIGKSLLCTKLLRDWSKGDLLRDSSKSFEHVFLFQFRWFNTGTTEMISLKQLMSLICPEQTMDNDVFQYMLDNPEKVLLIFDGLDEFKHHESCLVDEQAQGGNSPTEVMPFSALYVKLVKGKQLFGATVLTTSRPNVVQSVAWLKFDRKVEIMGFTPDKVQEYVCKFCTHDTETFNRIWGHISGNLELLSLCYIPVNSLIICSFMAELIKLQDRDSESALPTTSTEIYDGALRLFIFKHHPEFKGKPLTKDYLVGDVHFSESIEETLSQVGSLAKIGIEERRLVFDSTEVHGLENCGLFNRMPDTKTSCFTFKSHFCFIHLTLQEFLAAREIAKMDPSDLSDFITLNASDPKWHMVIQFVAGLLHGQEKIEAVNSFTKLLCDSMREDPPPIVKRKQNVLLMVKCFHEYNDETALEKAASELRRNSKLIYRIDLSECQVTATDCTAIVHFIKHLQENTALDLSDNNITDQGVSYLCDALNNINCKLIELNFVENNITDQGVSLLCNALKDVNCKLVELNLSRNNITAQGVSYLCDALKHVNCKLTKLHLGNNGITDQDLSYLCKALQDANCKLTELNLSNRYGIIHGKPRHLDPTVELSKLVDAIPLDAKNNLTDLAVSHLCEALKDENCKLNVLNLGGNKITEQSVTHLCDAVKDENCKLTQLQLDGSTITDQGISHLCDALKNVNCKLTELNLSNTYMSPQSVSYLCDALKDENCKLNKLNISCSYVTDQAVSHLCGALKDVNCKLTVLDLSMNNITNQVVSHLCDALKDANCKLTVLDLSMNNITNQGVSHLCDALKDANCKLTELNLKCTCCLNITDQAVSHLCEALKDVNCKLTVLDLSLNNITDQIIVFHLCDALKHIHCKLIKLSLTYNKMTSQGVSYLCSTLKDVNCKLTDVDLSGSFYTRTRYIQKCNMFLKVWTL